MVATLISKHSLQQCKEVSKNYYKRETTLDNIYTKQILTILLCRCERSIEETRKMVISQQ